MSETIIFSPLAAAPLFLKGLLMTIKLWISSASISLLVGVCLGILNSAQLQNRLGSLLISSYVFVLRGVPLYVQVLIVYFVLPDLIGINLSPFLAAVIALGLCSSAYTAEIVRCGVNAIPKGQWDACFVLGYTTLQTLRAIIIPQMVRNILPALVNELELLIKGTAILSTIGVLELTKVGTNIVARYMNPIPIYLAVACFYLAISAVLSLVSKKLERRFSYDLR